MKVKTRRKDLVQSGESAVIQGLGRGKKSPTKREQIKITLKYDQNQQSVIRTLKRISKPGRRVYLDKDGLRKAQKKIGLVIISTSQGLMTDWEARKRKIGGEVICEIT